MNNEESGILKNYFPVLNILFFALFTVQTIYFIVGLYMIQSAKIDGFGGFNPVFMFITPIVVLSLILASKFIYTKLVTQFDKSLSLDQKLVSYRTTNLIKLALLEGANIFNISIMIITANYFFALLFIIIIVFFFFNKPNKEKFIIDYEVSTNDLLNI